MTITNSFSYQEIVNPKQYSTVPIKVQLPKVAQIATKLLSDKNHKHGLNKPASSSTWNYGF